MTICIYKDGVLGADGRTTYTDGTIVTDNAVKIGLIWESKVDGTRSIYKDTLEEPKLFAAYGFAGAAFYMKKFVRWLTTTEHPDIDSENNLDFDACDITLDPDVPMSGMVVFVDYDFVRLYSSEYESHIYLDLPSNELVAIGSGEKIAKAINATNSLMRVDTIITNVAKLNTTCGGLITLYDLNKLK